MSEQSKVAIKVPDICEFIRGERDAKGGVPADVNGSENYQRGYGFQYAMAEMKSGGVLNAS